MNPSDICLIVLFTGGVIAYVWVSYLGWIEYLRPRWDHFRHRRDRGPFYAQPADVRLDTVRAILCEASCRAQRLRKGSDDNYVVMITEDPHRLLPRIWARVSIRARSITIALEFAEGCTTNEHQSVRDIFRFFAAEGNAACEIRCAPLPAEYEFLPSLQ